MPTDTATKTAEELEAERIAAETPTGDEQKALNELAGEMLGITSEEKKEPKVDKKEPEAKVEKKPKAKKKAPELKPEPVDYEAIAEASARGVAGVLKPAEEKKEPVIEKGEYDDIPDDEREVIPILQKMEKLYPEKYKGVTKRYAENLKATMEYQAKWEKENPDKTFDPDEDEHNDFFEKHKVDWGDADEKLARKTIIKEELAEELRKENSEKWDKLEQREKAREMEPMAYREAKRVGRKAFEVVGDEFKAIVGGDGTVDKAAVSKIFEKDPLAADIVFKEIQRIENICAESYRLHNGIVNFDANNPDHKFLAKYAADQEREIMALPKAEQTNAEGLKFAKASEFNQMTESQQSRHYRLTGEDLNDLLATEMAAKTRKLLETERAKFDAMAPKYGYKKGETTAAETVEPEPEPEDEKPVPVTTTSDALVSSTEKQGQHKPATGEQAFMNDFLKR